ncbi:MAG: DsrE family protein [Nitrospirae bacterium]|nr:DsrE family protein [Nitrospirota bacterium]
MTATPDKPTLMVVIYADPEANGAAAEALRMAMGLGTGNRTLSMVLMGPAARVLGDDLDDLVDGEMIENHLDVFADWETPFHVERAAMERYDLSGSPVGVIPVDTDGLARMMADAQQVMVVR